MILFLDIISFLFNFINTYFLFKILCRFLNIREQLIIRIISFLFCFPIVNIIIYANDITNILGVLIGFLIFAFVFYNDICIRKLSTVIIIYPMIVSVNYLAQDIGMHIFFMFIDASELNAKNVSTFKSTFIHTVSLVVAPVIWFSVWQMIKRMNVRSINLINTKMWLMIDGICLCVFTSILIILNFVPENPLINYPICFSGIATIFASLYMTIYISDSVQTAYQLQTIKMRHQYYEEKKQEEEKVRSIYHDMKNHLLVLENQSDMVETVKMSQKLRKEISDYENYIHTGCDILDIIIKDKSRKAKEKNIDFSATIDFYDVKFIESLDISTIFGNGIDNAIEATEKLPEEQRAVIIKAKIIHGFVMILIENTCNDRSKSKFKTSKEDKFLHGFGIRNMKKAVEKYNGECTSNCTDGKYNLKILIPINSEKRSAIK